MELTKKWFVSIENIERLQNLQLSLSALFWPMGFTKPLKLSYQIGLVGLSMGWEASEVNFPGAGHM